MKTITEELRPINIEETGIKQPAYNPNIGEMRARQEEKDRREGFHVPWRKGKDTLSDEEKHHGYLNRLNLRIKAVQEKQQEDTEANKNLGLAGKIGRGFKNYISYEHDIRERQKRLKKPDDTTEILKRGGLVGILITTGEKLDTKTKKDSAILSGGLAATAAAKALGTTGVKGARIGLELAGSLNPVTGMVVSAGSAIAQEKITNSASKRFEQAISRKLTINAQQTEKAPQEAQSRSGDKIRKFNEAFKSTTGTNEDKIVAKILGDSVTSLDQLPLETIIELKKAEKLFGWKVLGTKTFVAASMGAASIGAARVLHETGAFEVAGKLVKGAVHAGREIVKEKHPHTVLSGAASLHSTVLRETHKRVEHIVEIHKVSQAAKENKTVRIPTDDGYRDVNINNIKLPKAGVGTLSPDYQDLHLDPDTQPNLQKISQHVFDETRISPDSPLAHSGKLSKSVSEMYDIPGTDMKLRGVYSGAYDDIRVVEVFGKNNHAIPGWAFMDQHDGKILAMNPNIADEFKNNTHFDVKRVSDWDANWNSRLGTNYEGNMGNISISGVGDQKTLRLIDFSHDGTPLSEKSVSVMVGHDGNGNYIWADDIKLQDPDMYRKLIDIDGYKEVNGKLYPPGFGYEITEKVFPLVSAPTPPSGLCTGVPLDGDSDFDFKTIAIGTAAAAGLTGLAAYGIYKNRTRKTEKEETVGDADGEADAAGEHAPDPEDPLGHFAAFRLDPRAFEGLDLETFNETMNALNVSGYKKFYDPNIHAERDRGYYTNRIKTIDDAIEFLRNNRERLNDPALQDELRKHLEAFRLDRSAFRSFRRNNEQIEKDLENLYKGALSRLFHPRLDREEEFRERLNKIREAIEFFKIKANRDNYGREEEKAAAD